MYSFYYFMLLCICFFCSAQASLNPETVAISKFAQEIDLMCKNGTLISNYAQGEVAFIKTFKFSNGDIVEEVKNKDGSIRLEWKTSYCTKAVIEKRKDGFSQTYYTDNGLKMEQVKRGYFLDTSVKPCVNSLWSDNAVRELKYLENVFPFQRQPSLFTPNINTIKKHPYIKMAMVNNQIKDMPILNIDFNDKCKGADIIINIDQNNLGSVMQMAYHFLRNIEMEDSVPTYIISNVISCLWRKKEAESNVLFDCIKKKFFIDKEDSSIFFDKIIEYNDSYLKIFFEQIKGLQNSTKTYAFAMVIPQGEQAPFGIAIFIKYIGGFTECLLIGANDKTKKIIETISLKVSGKDLQNEKKEEISSLSNQERAYYQKIAETDKSNKLLTGIDNNSGNDEILDQNIYNDKNQVKKRIQEEVDKKIQYKQPEPKIGTNDIYFWCNWLRESIWTNQAFYREIQNVFFFVGFFFLFYILFF